MGTTLTKELLCNRALAHIHQTQTTISDFATDTGNTADQCRNHYDFCRQFVLADHNWSFARKRATLTTLAGTPPATWLYQYEYPDDCLRFREIERQYRLGDPPKWILENDSGTDIKILSDEADAIGIYTWDVELVTLFPPGFVSALGWYLASELAPALTGDQELQRTCYQIYQGQIAAAQAVSSQEGQWDDELESPWERARQGG